MLTKTASLKNIFFYSFFKIEIKSLMCESKIQDSLFVPLELMIYNEIKLGVIAVSLSFFQIFVYNQKAIILKGI